MISINFTGNTLMELANQAGLFASHIFQSATVFPQTPTEATVVDPLPLAGEPPIETGAAVAADEAIKRKRRTKAEMEAARAAEASVSSPGAQMDALKAAAEATAATPAPAASAPAIDEVVKTALKTGVMAPAEAQALVGVADVKAALMKVVEKDGLGPTAGGKLLAMYGVKRVSELEEKAFADFINACVQAVAA